MHLGIAELKDRFIEIAAAHHQLKFSNWKLKTHKPLNEPRPSIDRKQ